MIGSVELIGEDGSITVRIGGSLILEAQGVPMAKRHLNGCDPVFPRQLAREALMVKRINNVD